MGASSKQRKFCPQKIDPMSELVAYVDGGSLGNPGPSGIGVVISGCASGPVRIAKWIGRQDNNVAEYAAVRGLAKGADSACFLGFAGRRSADDRRI